MHDETSEAELIARVKRKAGLMGPENEMLTPEVREGLGSLLRETARFEVTDEEVESRVQETVVSNGSDPGWDRMTGQMIRHSCAFMAQELLSGPPQTPYNGRFFIGDHHMEWDELIAENKRLCVLAHRDSGKTYFFDFAYPIWKAMMNPGGSGFIFSATKIQAERILEDIKSEIENNPKLRWLMPGKKDKWSSSHIRLSNGHRIYARGFGTRVRGAHPQWIVVDDSLNDETAYSETVRQKQVDYFYTAITNMVVPGGQIIVVGTPFHRMDLYGDLKENAEYKFATYPAETAPGQPHNRALWPERYSLEDLARRRAEIGSIRYTREFLCEPVADDMSLFPSYLFKGQPTEQYTLKLGMDADFWKQAGVEIYMGVDFAMSTSVEADYTVVFVIGKDNHGNRWVIDIKREKGLAYQHQLSLINSVARKYDPALIFLEDNQMQRIFGDELIRTSDLPIKKFTTGVQKNSLDKGVPSLRVLLENHKVRIPRGDADTVAMTDIWIDEMRSFTWNEGKLQSVGGHDDTVMAMWICDQAIRQGGFQFSFGDEYGNTSQADKDNLLMELTGEVPERAGDMLGGEGTAVPEKPAESTVELAINALADPDLPAF